MSSKGQRESQWRVMHRCFNILLRLMRGRASGDEIRDIIRNDIGTDRKLTEKAVQRLFDEDKERLKIWFQVDMQYNRPTNDYELVHIGRALIDLSEEAVRGFAFLEQTFSQDGVVMGADVRAFLRTVKMTLPHPRFKEISKQRGLLELSLGVEDTDNIPPDVSKAVARSTWRRQQLEFDYLSPQQADRIPRRKIVEPIRHFFDAVRKHYYLEAFAIQSYAPHKGVRSQDGVVRKYRLDRMSNPKILPTHFNPNRRIPTKELIYELNANVARLGITEHFTNMQIYPNDDGSVKVMVPSRDLFFDLRTLLHYGANCRVIGGKDALYEMKRIIEDMSAVYRH